MSASSKPSASLEVKIHGPLADKTDPGAMIVSLIGDAGVAQAGQLARSLLQLTASHPPSVIFDLSQLAFISSLTMGELVAFQRGLHRHGGKVRLVAPQTNVLLALQRSQLDSVFEIQLQATGNMAG